ncbi:MAG: phage tail tape measure protein [Petrimonas sp.]|nr:phage tail tape measure protein [Petrimonas sp.]
MNTNTVVLTTLLNGEQAKRELDDLKVKAKTLALSIDDARKAGNHTFAKELTRDLAKTRNEMRALQRQTIDVNKVLNNLSTAKPKELKSVLSSLNQQLNSGNIKRGSREWDHLQTSIRKVRSEINKIAVESHVAESRMSRMANGFNKYFAGTMAIIGTITGVSFTLRKLSEDMAKMDDKYADVSKTTGLAREEVVALNEEFKKMDTRTAREQLNELARDAGKLGKSAQDEVMQFVRAGNQINVALGEDLGEGAIRNIGKITEVFKLSTRELDGMNLEQRMLAVGSAINELGQSSTANEAYLVNFTQRLGGVASQAGISVQDILGYASALDQSGQAVEMSATALQKFIMSVMGDPAKFARIAGVEVSKFNQLLKTDTNEAIKMVLKSLSEKGGFQQLIPVFQEMGLDGARAVGVLSSLATNIHLVDEAQRISNESFREGTSLTNEYNVKNNNLMAQLEKRRKEFKDAALELGERLNPALLKSTNYVTYLIKILPGVLDFLDKYGPTLLKITSLILAYNVGIKLQTAWIKLALIEKTKLFIANQKEIAQQTILALRFVFTSGSAKQLNTSLKALWTTTKLNPLGLLITVITAVGYGVYKWSQNNAKLLTQQSAMININKQVANSVGQERAELDMLLGIARNEKISKDERIKAINRLNEISPEYLGNLNLENINTNATRIAVEKYTKALMENARQKAIGEKMSDLYSQRLEKEAKIAEQQARAEGAGSEIRNLADRKIQSIQKEIENIDKQISVYQYLSETLMQNNKVANLTYVDREWQLMQETKLLDELQTQHAALYNKQLPSGVLRDSTEPQWGESSGLSDKAQLAFLTQKIERQKAIVAEKQKELDATKKIVKTEEDASSSTPGSGIEKDPLKEREASLKLSYDRQILSLKNKLLDERISEERYQREAYTALINHLLAMRQAQVDFKSDTTEVDTQFTDAMLSEASRRYRLLEDLQKQSAANLKNRPREEAVDEDYSPHNFQDEKMILDLRHEYGTISEEEYQEAIYELREKYLDKYLGKYMAIAEGIQNVTSDLSGAIDNFQRAEEMSVSRKYDKMIKAAGDNKNKIAKLEEEKEAAIHAVRAKYADKQFIITVANVISSTALAAMEAYKSAASIPLIGHILGPIAAGAAVLFGGSQIAIAKQQRDAAKEGYAGGGYTEKGNWWEEDGKVHKSEFVGNRFAVANPTVKKVFDVVDQAQRNNTVGSLSERDFQTALNYNEHTYRKVVDDIFSRYNPVQEGTENNNMMAAALIKSATASEKLAERLNDPIVAETYIEGKGGSKQANDLYNKMKKNVSRS